MSVETELCAVLAADPAVAALVGLGGSPAEYKIYPDAAPQGSELPAIVFTRVATEPIGVIHQAAALGESVTLDLHCLADSRTDADALAVAVANALAAGGFLPRDRRAEIEATADLDRIVWKAVLTTYRNSV